VRRVYGTQAFNSGDLLIVNGVDRCLTGAYGGAVQVNSAGTAKAFSTAEFCSCQVKLVPEHPEKGSFRLNIQPVPNTVNCQSYHGIYKRFVIFVENHYP
jgi:hypothetical protein